MLIRDSIDRATQVGSAAAVALACGAFLACRDRVCVISRGAPCGGAPGGVRHEFPSSPQNYLEVVRSISEVLRASFKYLNAWN